MKVYASFVVLCCIYFATSAWAVPLANDPVEIEAYDVIDAQPLQLDTVPELSQEPLQRYRRATCDLLSGFGVNHSLCASHCVLRGNRGGYCNSKQVCVCRN